MLPYRARLLLVVLLTVLISILVMLPPLVIKAIIDQVVVGGQRSQFLILALCLLGLPTGVAVCRNLQTVAIAYLGQRFVFDLRLALYQHILGLSLRFFGQTSVGKLVTRLMGDSGVVQQMLTAQSINIVSDLVCAGFAISATFLLNWRLAILLLLIVLVFVLNYRLNVGKIRHATRNYRSSMDRVTGGVQNRLVGALAVKTFGAENREQAVFSRESTASLELVQEAFEAGSTFTLNTQLIQGLGQALLYFGGCAMVLRGELTYGGVVAFTTYAMQLLGPAVRFSELAKQFQDVDIAVERLFEVFQEIPEIQESAHPKRIRQLRGQVDFNHLSFWYEKGVPVIREFDLHVKPGETIALIGPTGCGKSTILSLLMRFYDACEGQLLMDGIDIRKIRMKDLRRQFGIVLQEPMLFSSSILDNIRYARPQATLEEIQAAAKIAEIHEFIESLPEGYSSILGTEGLELSVGQKQRITIARAVVANPAILIMDEATSALDSDSERAIQLAMERVLKGRTSFIVAHRLSTIRNADHIVLLEDGRIREMGNHDELMELPHGRYRDLYTKHMGAGCLDE
jgi:ABC-type multidrug transport system fused ATPase/permease subunit